MKLLSFLITITYLTPVSLASPASNASLTRLHNAEDCTIDTAPNATLLAEPETKSVEESENDDEQLVTPMEVRGGKDGSINYNKLTDKFGTVDLTEQDLDRMGNLIKSISGMDLHPMIKRGLYYTHRDLNHIMTAAENGENFYLYTGRGPSSDSMHMGHLVPFLFTKYLQEAFDAPLVIQLTDDEKFWWKGVDHVAEDKEMTEKYGGRLEYFHHLARENAKDIIAFGFDLEKTFIFINTLYMGEMYPTVCKVNEKITYNTVKNIFGFDEEQSVNCGKVFYPGIQAAPSFSSCFKKQFDNKKLRCLIPCAVDQDPYFRMTRDIAEKIGEYKPSCLYSKFFPGLDKSGKMSSSTPNSTVFLTDTPKQIKKKINKSFSGGQDTAEKQRELGADLSVDAAFIYLKFFLDDDAELADIAEKYSKGEIMSGDVKKRCAEVLTKIVTDFQQRRAAVTDEELEEFMRIRSMPLPNYANLK